MIVEMPVDGDDDEEVLRAHIYVPHLFTGSCYTYTSWDGMS
jgi:hypothetical protein